MGVRAWPIPSSAGRLPIAAAVIVGLLASSCSPALSPSPAASAPVTGGTLKVVVVANGTEALEGAPYYDPAVYWSFSPLNRCCLGRTLLSYNGRPPEEGGAELHPDLAAGLPEVSRDGLTWTFLLKPNIRYAPPLDDRVIEARDFVTALEYAVRHDHAGDPPLPAGF
jgi:ABC-type transport system substrate-binding protein